MKILKIICIGLSVLTLFIFIGILIFLQFFDINKFLPQITKQVSQSIGRQVKVNHANLNFDLVHGLVLDLKILTISDQALPTSHDFIVIDNTRVGLDLSVLLFKREISATDIQFNSVLVSLEPYHFNIQNIQAKIEKFSLNKPFDLKIKIKAYSKVADNIEINAQGALDLNKSSLQITNLWIKSDLNLWDWAKVRTIALVLKDFSVWPLQDLKGNISVFIPMITLSAEGMGDFSIQIQSQIGGGTIDAKADIKEISTAPEYNFKFYPKAIKVENIIDQTSWPIAFKGALTGQFLGSGVGDSIEGQGNIQCSDVKLEKLNILKIILEKLNFIPGLGNILQGVLPSDIKDKLNADTTVLTKLQTNFKVANKIISIDQAQMESNLFSIGAQGTVTFDLSASIDVNTYLASDISAAFIKKVKPLRGLLDEQNRIYIPGQVSGQLPVFKYLPQVDYITKKVITSEGSEQISQQLDTVLEKNPQIRSILNAVLGGGSDQNSPSEINANSANDQSDNIDTLDQDKQGSTKKLINNILKDILH